MLQIVYKKKQYTVNLSDVNVVCIPAVYFNKETGECGICLTGISGGFHIEHNVQGPKDLIALWRTTEALRSLEEIDSLDLIDSIFRVMSYLGEVDITEIKSVSDLIGPDVCNRILSSRVPDEIIRFIVDNQEIKFPPTMAAVVAEAEVQHN